jgi:DNA-binding NtrC family response regulator
LYTAANDVNRAGSSSSSTRIINAPRGRQQLAVRRAKLRVIRGPDAGLEVELGERLGATIGTDPDADLVLTDDSVSQLHAEIRAESTGFVLRDLGSTNGTRVGDVIVREAVLAGTKMLVAVGESVLELRPLRDEVKLPLSPHANFGAVLGESAVMRQVFEQLERAATSSSTVLLEGPSGSGKELIASALHERSPRADQAFVVLDCGALPASTIESELFGHRKGAFTGAVEDRDGLFAEASGGTLFLDEVAELPLELQPKLLGVLERRQTTRLGDTQPRDVDLRVIAASQHDLQRRVERGLFRKDLYFRLAVVKITVPPLRHRRQDVALLAREFVRQLRPDLEPDSVLTGELLTAMAGHAWPGNVRELRNVIERLLAVGTVTTALRGGRAPVAVYTQARRDAIDRFEQDYCARLMHEARGVATEAARRAGLSRQMWHRLLKKHGLDGRDGEPL